MIMISRGSRYHTEVISVCLGTYMILELRTVEAMPADIATVIVLSDM